MLATRICVWMLRFSAYSNCPCIFMLVRHLSHILWTVLVFHARRLISNSQRYHFDSARSEALSSATRIIYRRPRMADSRPTSHTSLRCSYHHFGRHNRFSPFYAITRSSIGPTCATSFHQYLRIWRACDDTWAFSERRADDGLPIASTSTFISHRTLGNRRWQHTLFRRAFRAL